MTAEPMKTNHINVTNRTAKQLPCILAASITAFLGLSGLAQGQTDLFWTGESGRLPEQAINGSWDFSSLLWSNGESTPGNMPWENFSVAHFVGLNGAEITLATGITASGIDYGLQAGAFVIRTNGNTLILDGAGITNSSGTMQTFDNTGEIVLEGNSSGGNAAFVNGDTADIDISGLDSAGATMGSIAGSGTIFLGSKNLAVGSNNSSTLFSGIISDDGEFGGAGGSLTKVGAGTLTLTGVNTYTGITT